MDSPSPVPPSEGGIPSRRPRTLTWFLAATSTTLAVLVLLLARQNRQLRSRLDLETRARIVERRTAAAVNVGDHLDSLVPSFSPPPLPPDPTHSGESPSTATILDPLAFDDNARPATILFLFDGGCDACDSSVAPVARLAMLSAPRGIITAAVQMDAKSPEDLKHTGHGFPVRGIADRQGTWLARVAGVPGLVIIDGRAVVRGVWWGAIDPTTEAAAQRTLEQLAH